VKTGSRDETDEIAGVSHFLEHMVFKGTPSRSAADVNREFDEMGAYYNAFTSEENTVYYAAVLPEFQARSIELLADILRPSLREDDFDTEKKVILEEIQMYKDQPPFGADDTVKALHLPGHPLARSVLGTAETVSALRPEAMRAYFQRQYSPRNIVVATAGRVDFPELIEQVAKRCGQWPSREVTRETPRAASHTAFEVVTNPSAAQQYFLQLASGPAAGDPLTERFAAKLLATIVGDDSGSRMYWELVDSGLAEHASLSHHEYDGTGMYMVYASCDPSGAGDLAQRLADILRTVDREGVTDEEVRLAKSKIKSRVVIGSERPRNRLYYVGGNWLSRREYRALREDLRALDAITRDQINALAEQYPLSENTSLTVGPLESVPRPA
jgi:predicted Zn-dependent peptidase